MTADFNPGFSFDVDGLESGPAQAAWEFSGEHYLLAGLTGPVLPCERQKLYNRSYREPSGGTNVAPQAP